MTTFSTLDAIVRGANESESVQQLLKGERRVIQFNAGSSSFLLTIREDGKAELRQGTDAGATVTLTAEDGVMDDVLSGRINGMQAFMAGKLKLSGNIVAAQKLVSVLEKMK